MYYAHHARTIFEGPFFVVVVVVDGLTHTHSATDGHGSSYPYIVKKKGKRRAVIYDDNVSTAPAFISLARAAAHRSEWCVHAVSQAELRRVRVCARVCVYFMRSLAHMG